MTIPNFQDRVKHKTSAENTTGIVIAKYPNLDVHDGSLVIRNPMFKQTTQLLDVRTDDDRIIYGTPAENWETISTEEDRLNE